MDAHICMSGVLKEKFTLACSRKIHPAPMGKSAVRRGGGRGLRKKFVSDNSKCIRKSKGGGVN